MSQIEVEVSLEIPVSPEKIYDIIADYEVGHPAILPHPYFTGITVEQGGRGSGTVIRVQMAVMGVRQEFLMEVSELEPGRVLVESDPEAGVVTTFTIDPLDEGRRSRVTIHTTSRTAPGLRGMVEKLVNRPVMRHIYEKELAQLAEVAGR